jgi:hypothetical protein
MSQRAKRRANHPQVGPRAFVLFIVVALVIGIIGISVNANFEKWENVHEVDQGS